MLCVLMATLLAGSCEASDVTQDPSTGWTPLAPASDTRRVHVSSSSGSDDNDGLTAQSPKATLRAAKELLRDGHPDWLLIKRGDEFAEAPGDWEYSGRSAAEPMVVSTFGTEGERPVFHCHGGDGLTVHRKPVHDVAFVGLHLVGHSLNRDGCYGISLLAPSTRVLIEDCRVERFAVNLRFQGWKGLHRDLKLRRSVVIDAFTVSDSHAQGMYVEEVQGCLIEECVFDHNGWQTDVPRAEATKFRHNLYIQGNTSDVVVRGNIIARGGSHGLQARSGGDIRNNLFLANAINLLVGLDVQNSGAVTATVIGNVILDGRNISAAEPRGWAAQFQCLSSAEIAYNVAAHQTSGTQPGSYELDSRRGAGIRNVDFHHNVAYAWGAPLTLHGDRFDGLVLRNNHVQDFSGGALFSCAAGAVAGFSSRDNRFYSTAPERAWMLQSGKPMSVKDWKAAVADSTSVAAAATYPHAKRTIADYDRSTGGRGSLESFLARAREQSRSSWNDQLVGCNAAAHFRANFGVVVPLADAGSAR
jgi:hypothetical protein